MSRLVPYINKPSDEVLRLLDEAVDMRLYLVQETGPTGFILKDDSANKFKVQIGSLLSCSCGGGSKKKKHCVHLLFALMKIFRLEVSNPLIWQLSYVDREVDTIIQNRYDVRPRAVPKIRKKKAEPEEKFVARLTLEDEGPCSICFEDMSGEERLTYCRTGCGHNIHAYCMKMWATQKEVQRVAITCPLCRQDWGPKALEYIRKDSQKLKESNSYKETIHVGYFCKGCSKEPIRGKLYHCLVCSDYDLCNFCFDQAKHIAHSFVCKESVSAQWEVAKRHGQGNGHMRQMMESLQDREISPLDYDLLLGLDGRNDPTPVTLEGYFVSNITVLKQENPFACADIRCCVCNETADSDKWRQLPCAHYVHYKCAFGLFESNANKCPRDQRPIFPGWETALSPPKVTSKRTSKKSHKKNDVRELASQVGSLALEVQGTHVRETPSSLRSTYEEFKSPTTTTTTTNTRATSNIPHNDLFNPNSISIGGSSIPFSSQRSSTATASRSKSKPRPQRHSTIRTNGHNIMSSSSTSGFDTNSSQHVRFGGGPGDMRANRRGGDWKVDRAMARVKPPISGGRVGQRRHVADMEMVRGVLMTNQINR